MSVILALTRERQQDFYELEARLGSIQVLDSLGYNGTAGVTLISS